MERIVSIPQKSYHDVKSTRVANHVSYNDTFQCTVRHVPNNTVIPSKSEQCSKTNQGIQTLSMTRQQEVASAGWMSTHPSNIRSQNTEWYIRMTYFKLQNNLHKNERKKNAGTFYCTIVTSSLKDIFFYVFSFVSFVRNRYYLKWQSFPFIGLTSIS